MAGLIFLFDDTSEAVHLRTTPAKSHTTYFLSEFPAVAGEGNQRQMYPTSALPSSAILRRIAQDVLCSCLMFLRCVPDSNGHPPSRHNEWHAGDHHGHRGRLGQPHLKWR